VGGALAMLACQLVATFPRAWFVLGGRGAVHPVFQLGSLAPVREILRVGVPAALSTSISNVGLMVLTGVVARLGAPDLAAYGLGTRLDFLLLSFAYGFGAAVLTLVGMASGARRHDLVRAFVVRAGAITTAILAVAGGVLCWRPSLWLGIFTDDPGIHAVGTTYFRIIGPSYAFLGVSMVIAFAFQGLGRATVPMVWMAMRVAGVLVVAVVCTRMGLGERAVFTTIALGNVASAAGMLVLFLRTERGLLAPPPVAVAQASATTSR
jgi:Na+-driven multidrug efflux pump